MLGLNLKAQIWQINQSSDDSVGGSVTTGTVAYTNVPIRLSARRPSQASLEAGLEVNRITDAIINGKGLTLRERDEIEITWPVDDPYYGERFRITGIQLDSRRKQIGHTELTLSRIERSRSQQ